MEPMISVSFLEKLGWVASILLPFFNIPLMLRMIQRRSSADLSLLWVSGVFLCLLAMEPVALMSPDRLFKVFATMNVILYSGVAFLAFFFRIKRFRERD
ncbi:MAG: hypothetical protein HY542_04400 [Deltaproteobacteria bacterium]|nr:hypothetical protein [Deltaproteobacteria bacterium]